MKGMLTMKHRVKLITTLSLVIFITVFIAYSQDNSKEGNVDAFERAKQEYALRSNDEKKLQSGMFELLKAAEASDSSDAAKQNFKNILRIDKSLKADSKDRVRVMVHFKSIFDITEFLQSSDGVVEETYPNFPYVLCKIHPKKLRALASLSSVITIQRNVEVHTNTIER
jgi:hypothetical protein